MRAGQPPAPVLYYTALHCMAKCTEKAAKRATVVTPRLAAVRSRLGKWVLGVDRERAGKENRMNSEGAGEGQGSRRDIGRKENGKS